MFERQIYQNIFTIISIVALGSFGSGIGTGGPALFGLELRHWYLLGILCPILHHTYVWFCWRSQLIFQWPSKLLGKKVLEIYASGFFVLALARVLPVFVVAYLDHGSIYIPRFFSHGLSGLMTILSGYAMYSVFRYFGAKRATGADHFDESYRNKPFVKEGIFKYTRNGMYGFAVLFIWVPGLVADSQYALALAAFNHIYVWVHYYCLELPDIKRIYGR